MGKFTVYGDYVDDDPRVHHRNKIAHHKNVIEEIHGYAGSSMVNGIGLPLLYQRLWIKYHERKLSQLGE